MNEQTDKRAERIDVIFVVEVLGFLSHTHLRCLISTSLILSLDLHHLRLQLLHLLHLNVLFKRQKHYQTIDNYRNDQDRNTDIGIWCNKVYKLRRKIGIVFQDFKLLPKLTVYENVAFALECVGMKDKEIRPKVMSALERVGLKDKVRSFPGELSGGEQQRVCIARAIVNRPKLLICDEPTGNLDPDTSKEIMKVIEGINKDLGTTIIMATHDRDIVNRMKKRVLLIEHGVLAGDYAKGSYKTHEGV